MLLLAKKGKLLVLYQLHLCNPPLAYHFLSKKCEVDKSISLMLAIDNQPDRAGARDDEGALVSTFLRLFSIYHFNDLCFVR